MATFDRQRNRLRFCAFQFTTHRDTYKGIDLEVLGFMTGEENGLG